MMRAGAKAIAGLRRGRTGRCAAMAGLFAVLASRCGGEGTALFIRAELAQIAPVTQLRVTGQTLNGIVFGPFTRPEKAAGPLPNAQTVRVLLPDYLGGQTVRVSVHGLSERVLGLGEAEAIVSRGDEVPLTVRLAPLSSAIDPACSSCLACCENGTCRNRSVSRCAPAGEACQSCNPVAADSCSLGGECRCGAGLPCSSGRRCESGTCR